MNRYEKDAMTHPLKTCVSRRHGLDVGIPPKLREYRDEIFSLVPRRMGRSITVVEIGSLQGWLAWRVMKHLPEATIYCVDPYEGEDGLYNLSCWKKNLRPYWGKRAFLKRGYSNEVASTWPKTIPVDWIFIDGDHRTEAVYLDLESWVPLVRTGGLISGHDIEGEWGEQVKEALDRYGRLNGIKKINMGAVYSFTGVKTTPCWWFYKERGDAKQDSAI